MSNIDTIYAGDPQRAIGTITRVNGGYRWKAAIPDPWDAADEFSDGPGPRMQYDPDQPVYFMHGSTDTWAEAVDAVTLHAVGDVGAQANVYCERENCPDCDDFRPVTADCCGDTVCECHIAWDGIDDTIAVCLNGHGCHAH